MEDKQTKNNGMAHEKKGKWQAKKDNYVVLFSTWAWEGFQD